MATAFANWTPAKTFRPILQIESQDYMLYPDLDQGVLQLYKLKDRRKAETVYVLRCLADHLECSCPGYQHYQKCKHLRALTKLFQIFGWFASQGRGTKHESGKPASSPPSP